MRLQNYIEDISIEEDAMNLLTLGILLEEVGRLDEAIDIGTIKDKTVGLLKKMGLKMSTGKGLVQYLFTINKNILRLIYHGISLGDAAEHQREASKKAIKEIMGSVSKEDVVNFLYKLDQLTLGVLTTPLKLIDAVTGWHIAADVSKKIKPAVERAKQAIHWLESAKSSLEGKLKAQVQKYVNALRRVFNLGNFGKI